MKVAVCMSGIARSFDKCYKSFIDNVLNLYDCDVFTFVSNDSNAKSLDLINHTKKIIVDNEPKHDEKDYILHKARRTKKYTIQGWLSQFWKIKMCHEMMINYSKENNIKYDWVIRCRPDLYYFRKIDDLLKLDNNIMYLPVFPVGPKLDREMLYEKNYIYDYKDNMGFIPDQFAISSVDLMTIYAKRFDDLEHITHSENHHLLCSEYSLSRQLNFYNVKVKFIKPMYGIHRGNRLIVNQWGGSEINWQT